MLRIPSLVSPLANVALRPNKAENGSFSALFFAFSGQNRAFSHHFRTTRNSENFLITYLTTVGAGAIRLVASAPVRSAHEKLNSKGSRRCSPRTFFFVSCVSVFILTFYSSLKNIAFCAIIWLYNFLSHIGRVIASGISSRSGVPDRFSLGHTVLQKFKCSVRRLYKV